jgi:ribosomal protein S18 acetylase RimI-like enzyme
VRGRKAPHPDGALPDMTEPLHLRPQTDADRPFLAALYTSTRAQEMAAVPWTDEQKQDFCQWQFDSQSSHYAENYAQADFLIIEQGGTAIGRLYIDRGPMEIEIVDIALLPQYRGSGLGAGLLRDILREGEESGKPVTIYVEHFNPARHLYDRLGFQHVDTNGVYHLMKWTPAGVDPAGA